MKLKVYLQLTAMVGVITLTALALISPLNWANNIGYFLFMLNSVVMGTISIILPISMLSADPEFTAMNEQLVKMKSTPQDFYNTAKLGNFLGLLGLINIFLIAKNGGLSILLAFIGFMPIIGNSFIKYYAGKLLEMGKSE